jgi:hypothetical protein
LGLVPIPGNEEGATISRNSLIENGGQGWIRASIHIREQIKKRMTKEQIDEGQKLTLEWLERKAKEQGE